MSNLAAAISLLSDSRSPKRRAGAKQLRRLKDPSAGPALLSALQKEVQGPRAWEPLYHMIMALGECDYRPALQYLETLAQLPFTATSIYVALGDSIVRLGREHTDDPAPVLRLMQIENDMLTDGAFRAVAMLRLKLNEDAVRQIVSYVSRRPLNDPLRFWVAAASAGWDGPEVEAFLQACISGSRDDTRQAAAAALQKRYLKWNPL